MVTSVTVTVVELLGVDTCPCTESIMPWALIINTHTNVLAELFFKFVYSLSRLNTGLIKRLLLFVQR